MLPGGIRFSEGSQPLRSVPEGTASGLDFRELDQDSSIFREVERAKVQE